MYMNGCQVDFPWVFESPTMRFTGSFSKDHDELSGIWEQSEDSKQWQRWMEIKLSRAT
jgi:hypothetical protein